MLRKFVLFIASSLIMLSGIVAIDALPSQSHAATHRKVSSVFTRKISRAAIGHMITVPSGTHTLPIPARGPELPKGTARGITGIKGHAVLSPHGGGSLPPPPSGGGWQP